MFEAAVVAKPNLSVLSDAFLAQVQALPTKDVAVELLRRLLEDEVADALPPQHRSGQVVRGHARESTPFCDTATVRSKRPP